jgi:hypothetical protein
MPSHDPASHEPEHSDSGMSSPDADGGPLDAGARDVMPMDSGQSDAGEPSIPEPDGGEHDAGAEAVRLPGFVEVPWVVDMAAGREMLYVVSGWSQLYRHFLDGRAPDPEPLDLGVGVPSGVDVSPDMKWLVVADGSLREGWLGCNLVELATGEVRWVDVDRAEPGETGTFMPQFIAEHLVLCSTRAGSPSTCCTRSKTRRSGPSASSSPMALRFRPSSRRASSSRGRSRSSQAPSGARSS